MVINYKIQIEKRYIYLTECGNEANTQSCFP